MPVKNMTCPGCGAAYDGKRCRCCGYTHFSETDMPGKTARAASPKRERRKHPLLGFLILLYLIYALLPWLRSWGLKLEDMENAARSNSTHQSGEYDHG